MTTWIGTNQVGWDANEIGFHSIQGCTGLVLRTDHWVAGWHVGGGGGGNNYNYSGMSKIGFQGSAFLTYIKTIAPNPWPAVGMLAGTVKLWIIHHGQNDWKSQLDDFAGLIGYHGRARGFNIRSHYGASDSCDVVVTRVGDSCEIRYKLTGKMTHTPQSLTQMQASPVQKIFCPTPTTTITGAITMPESHSATIVQTKSNKGRMHFASKMSQKSHTV